MPNRGSNLDILQALYGLAPEDGESYKDFLTRIVVTINEDEVHWEDLTEPMQQWFMETSEALKEEGVTLDNVEFSDFPGVKKEDYEKPAAKKSSDKAKAAPKARAKAAPKVKAKAEPKVKAKAEPKVKAKAPAKKSSVPNAALIRNKVFSNFGISFAEVLAYLKDEGVDAKESSVKLVYVSAVKDVTTIVELGKVTDAEGTVILTTR